MAATALDLGLRGAAVGLFLVVCLALLRHTAVSLAAKLGIAMGVAGAAFAISTAPFFPIWSFGWNSPFIMLAMGAPVIFWLWVRASFDPDFALQPWHGAVWAAVAGLGVVTYNGWTDWQALAVTSGHILSLVSIAFALLAVAQMSKGWRKGLATGPGRLRIALVIGISTQIVLQSAAGLAAIPMRSFSLTAAFALGVAGILSIWMMLFYPPEREPAVAGIPRGEGIRASGSFAPADLSAADRACLHRLRHLMTVERAYRQEGLTIGQLAIKLGLPEHRLRTLIRDGLAERNFNAFLNRYRIDEAKAALADPSQAGVSVLTIALDAGFQSLAPFNRAFKADTGLTPTEFRRKAAGAEPNATGEAAIALSN